jgi:hypothetical protein
MSRHKSPSREGEDETLNESTFRNFPGGVQSFFNPDGKSLKTQVYGRHSYPDYRFDSGPGAKFGKIFSD